MKSVPFESRKHSVEPLRPSYLDMSGKTGWELIPAVITRPVLTVLLGSLGAGLAVLSRFKWSVRAQVTRTLSLEISTADGVCRRWYFDGRTRRITSTTRPSGEPDHQIHFRSSSQALGALTSRRAIDKMVAGIAQHQMQLRGHAFILVWFYGLTRQLVRIGRTRGPRRPVPGGYVRPDPSRDGPEPIIREPAVEELDPDWQNAWTARARLWTVRAGNREPMPEP
jgi:hypothetical protein